MSDSQVAELRKGQRVRDAEGRLYTVTSDAKMARSNTHHEAWAVSASGQVVVRVTMNGAYRLEA